MENAMGTSLNRTSRHLTTPDHSPYKTKLGSPKFDKHPFSMSFYYIKVNADQSWQSTHYFYDQNTDIEEEHLDLVLPYLADNAIKGKNIPPKHGENFREVIWRRKSFIAFVVDSADFKLKDGEEGLIVEHQSHPNHTFFDARYIDTGNWEDSAGNLLNNLSCILCINHMKGNKYGQDIGEREEKVYFSLQLESRGAAAQGRGLAAEFSIDSGGTNTGPPVSPPFIGDLLKLLKRLASLFGKSKDR